MFNKPDQPRDLNFLQILRDIAERKLLKGKVPDRKPGDPPVDENAEDENTDKGNGMDTLPAKAIVEEGPGSSSMSGTQSGTKTAAAAPATGEAPGTKRVSSENYRQLYLEQRAQEAAASADHKKALEKYKTSGGTDPILTAREKAAKDAMQKKVADNYRFRARELQSQIVWWQQQSGAGQYSEDTVTSTIATLRQELSGIPNEYW